jgi:hypothetical protein
MLLHNDGRQNNHISHKGLQLYDHGVLAMKRIGAAKTADPDNADTNAHGGVLLLE